MEDIKNISNSPYPINKVLKEDIITNTESNIENIERHKFKILVVSNFSSKSFIRL